MNIISDNTNYISGVNNMSKMMFDLMKITSDSKAKFINLGVGNPAFLPESAEMWKKAAERVVGASSFSNIVGQYSSGRGYPQFIESVVSILNRECDLSITSKNVLITNGSQTALFMLLNLLIGKSNGIARKLLIPLVPEYVGYESLLLSPEHVEAVLGKEVILEDHLFKYSLDKESINFDDNIGAILISRPMNPSGNVISDEELNFILTEAKKRNIIVIIDGAYADPFPSLTVEKCTPIFDEDVIYTMSLSKAGLPGERVGITIGSEEIINRLLNFQINISMHASVFGQALGNEVIKNGELLSISKTYLKPYYIEQYNYLHGILNDITKVDWYLHKYEGGMFAWLWLKDLPITDIELYEKCLEQNVIVMPGSYFYPGIKDNEQIHRSIRISLSPNKEILTQGLQIITKIINGL